MAPSHDQLRVLLLQARKMKDMELQEIHCFLERCRLEPYQLDNFNLAFSPTAEIDGFFDGYDAFFIGGAGEYSAVENYEWMPLALDLVREAYRLEIPTFGSCWGHQLIARALGGQVVHDPDKAEMGCHHIELTDAGQRDTLFCDFPHSFLANTGHHDRVTILPESAVELAFNRTQPNEAFRIVDRPMFGTQFHSELDAHRERERLVRYRQHYLDEIGSEEVFQSVLRALRETTEVDHLMHDFLTKFAIEPE